LTLRIELALLLAVPLLAGCAVVPYEYGPAPSAPGLPLAEEEPQIERGRPNALLDGLGHYLLSLPTKLLLLSWRVDSHRISPETEEAIRSYLADNELGHVKVRLNQYAPGDEWNRLFANPEIHPLLRYTVGALTVAAYTIFPNRLFGGDHYNPFTNTVHLFSDERAIALHEGGHAKDFSRRISKGSYALLRSLPLVPLHQEALATGDALGYERATHNLDGERRAYQILYPAYGTYVGGEIVRWLPLTSTGLAYAIQYGVVVPGHLIGRIRARLVDDDLDRIPPPRRATPPAASAKRSGTPESW
jgi:hypothetical protein